MITSKAFRLDIVFKDTYKIILLSIITASSAFFIYRYLPINLYEVPGFIITTMGTALAIFLGFRNSSAYDRWWEARKIWGGVVNYSRSWARATGSLIEAPEREDQPAVHTFYRELVYRHLAWINALRLQLRRQEDPGLWDREVAPFLSPEEYRLVPGYRNAATQLLKKQSERTAWALKQGWLDNFSRLHLEEIMNELYNLQGRSERIKNSPMGKYYVFFTLIFLVAFVTILPFSILSAFEAFNNPFLVFPLTTIVSWVFYIIFMIGSEKENPFENSPYDIALTAICRTIEIDLRQMLEEDPLPLPIQPHRGFLY